MKNITEIKFEHDFLVCPYYFWNCKTESQLDDWHSNPTLRRNMPGGLITGDQQFQALLSIVQNNRPLFSLVTTTIPTMTGWCSLEKACALASLTLAIKPSHVCELGVWGGRSLLPVAMAMQSLGSGLITGIDPYSPQESSSGQFGANADWWGQQDHKAIRDKFLQFVAAFKLEKHVRLIEQASGKVDTTTMKIQILHSDANHGESALNDAKKYGPLVQIGGFVLADDLGWEGGAVLRSIEEYESQGFVEVFRRTEGGDNWCLMQKVK